MKIPLFIAVSLLIWSNVAGQPCPANVTATAMPKKVCPGGGVVNLIGDVTGPNILSWEWTPHIGIANPFSLSTTANVNFPITYTLTARALTDNDVIVNGNFSGGAGGFLSNYVNNPLDLSAEGTYAVTSNPSAVHPDFAPCGDHTSGSGNMMVVNGASIPGQSVWCQTINVNPTSDYIFSAWVTSVHSTSPAILQFSVNGTLLGAPFNAPGSLCSWSNFQGEWSANGVSVALICIVNQNTALAGNDFALDDISFLEVCRDTAQVRVEVVNLQALAVATGIINCTNRMVELDGSLSTAGPNISYLWTTANGNIVSGETTTRPTVDEPGNYTLTVTYNDGNGTVCEKSVNVVVPGDPDTPLALAEAPHMIDCVYDTVVIDGSQSTSGQGFIYFWTPRNGGHIVSGVNTLRPSVDQPGDYWLTVLSTISGCRDSFLVQITSDTIEPVSALLPPDIIDCTNDSILLNGNGSSTGQNISYQWQTLGGHILSNPTNRTAWVDSSGLYRFIVVNTRNGCRDTAEVQVDYDKDIPEALLEQPDVLNCINNEILIAGDLQDTSSTILQVRWTLPDGSSVDQDSLNLLVTEPGTYYLTITNPLNQCEYLDSVEVLENMNIPDAVAGPDTELLCNVPNLTLDATGSSTGMDYIYEWITNDGNIIGDSISITALINEAGTYIFMVTDTVSGCQALDSVVVTRDAEAPDVLIEQPDMLTCEVTELVLDAEDSSQGGNFQIQWQTSDGNLVSGQNSLSPMVDEPGTYVLIITDLNNNCAATSSIVVQEDMTAPDIDAGPSLTLNCGNPTLPLEGQLLNNVDNYVLSWNTGDGNIVSGGNTFTPLVDSEGTYELTVRNTDNGCISTTSVLVEEDFEQPEALAAIPDTLTCEVNDVIINASGSSDGSEFDYQWTDPGGNVVTSADRQRLQVSTPGIFQLIISNNDNLCADTLHVEIVEDRVEPLAEAGPSMILTCADPSVTLDGTGSSAGSNIMYSWSTPNGAIAGFPYDNILSVSVDGIYFLNVMNENNGCEAIDSVVVGEDTTPPLIAIANPDTLTCQRTQIGIDASGSSQGTNFEYTWSTANGNILNGGNSLTPMVGQAGDYLLTILNMDNGCTISQSISVEQDADFPVAAISTPDALTCSVQQLVLDAGNSSTGGNFSYLWTTSDGTIVSGGNTPNPMIGAPGSYTLEVTNSINNCRSTATVEVTENVELPIIQASQPGELTCALRQMQLDAIATGSGNNFSFNWTTTDGDILSGESSSNPLIGEAGTYSVEVTDLENGCTSTETLMVFENVDEPQLSAVNPGILTCIVEEMTLQVTAAGTGNNFSYSWTTTDGNIISGNNTSSPLVNEAGAYMVTVIDNENGCQHDTLLEVHQDIASPLVMAETPGEITCRNQTLTLDGSGSSTGAGFIYSWTTSDGDIFSGENTLSPVISAPGLYTLEVTNSGNGCSETADIQVNADTVHPAIVIANPNILTCIETEVILDANASDSGSDFLFNWQTSNGNILSGQNTPEPLVNRSGNYTLTLLNDENGCSSSSTITVGQDVRTPLAEAGPDDELNCTDVISVLTGVASSPNGNYSLSWTTQDGNFLSGSGTLTPTVDQPGVYYLVITDMINGCKATDSVQVILDENILLDVETRTEEPKCYGEKGSILVETLMGGTPPFQYSIDGGEHFSSGNYFSFLDAGIYELVVRDSKGCEIEEDLEIPFVPQIDVSLQPQIILELGNEHTLVPQLNFDVNRIASISWTPADNLSCSDCLNPVVTATTQTVYEINIVDINGCPISARTTVVVRKELNVYIPSAFSPNNSDGINDIFMIYAKPDIVANITNFKIFDRWGEEVFEAQNFLPNDPAYGWDGYFRAQRLNPGVFVYFAEIEFKDGSTKIFKGDVTLVQ